MAFHLPSLFFSPKRALDVGMLREMKRKRKNIHPPEIFDGTLQPIVAAHDLVKRFDSFVAVDGIDVEIFQGESFGFLGPNGAGKTSTMRMISCMSPASGGSLRVLGRDPAVAGAQIRSRLGLVPQEDTLELELTVLDQ